MSDERCAVHGRTAAVTSCAACGRRLCQECVVHTGVGFKCADCTGDAAATATSGILHPRSWRVSPVAAAAVIGALIVGGAAAFAIFRPSPMQQVGGALDATGASDSDHDTLDVAFDGGDGVTLRGTLTVPAGLEHHAPAVVIVPGFGTTDRDGVVGPSDPIYRDLAETLADQGLISLRYDNPGVGESDPVPDGEPLTFDRRVGHAAAGVAYVRERGEVDGGQVAVTGHDEGGLAAMDVAGDDANLAGVVLIATPGRPYVDILVDAFRASDDEEHDAVAEEIDRAVAELLETGEMPEIDQSVGMGIEQLLPEGQDEYLHSIFSLEPTELAAEVTSPVLIVHPDRLPQLGRDTDVEPLRDALTEAAAVDVLIRPDAGYTLNLLDEDASGNETGPADGVLGRDDEALEDIAGWLVEQFGSS